jgi:hypothetical protein
MIRFRYAQSAGQWLDFDSNVSKLKGYRMNSSIRMAGISCIILAASAASAFAAGAKIVNHSGLPIDELSVSAPGAKQWGDNLLKGTKEGVLDDGKTYTVKGLKDGTYDFQISAPDEAVFCVMPAVTVKGGAATLTADMGKTCK